MKRCLLIVLLSVLCAGIAHAAIDAYAFRDDAERARYSELTRELRCPKCQNQDIADSNAPIAADLRKEIYRMLGEGQSNQQIIDFMVDRYGDFVRYKPSLTARTAAVVRAGRPAGRRPCGDRVYRWPPPQGAIRAGRRAFRR